MSVVVETPNSKTPRILAYLVVIAAFSLEGFILFHGTPDNIDGVVLGRTLGMLDSSVLIVLTYYFGSSAGSSQKNQVIAEMVQSGAGKKENP